MSTVLPWSADEIRCLRAELTVMNALRVASEKYRDEWRKETIALREQLDTERASQISAVNQMLAAEVDAKQLREQLVKRTDALKIVAKSIKGEMIEHAIVDMTMRSLGDVVKAALSDEQDGK